MNVRVEDARLEVHLGGDDWVLLGQRDFDLEDTLAVRAVLWAVDVRQPVQDVFLVED